MLKRVGETPQQLPQRGQVPHRTVETPAVVRREAEPGSDIQYRMIQAQLRQEAARAHAEHTEPSSTGMLQDAQTTTHVADMHGPASAIELFPIGDEGFRIPGPRLW